MPTTCNIEFENNPIKVVYAGQLLRGTVQLNLTKQKNVCGVYVRIHGEAFVQWKEGRRELTGNENYLNERMYFVGERNGEVRLEPGTYNYTFQCMLPPELPTSTEGRYGHVRYNIRVVLDRSMWPDKKFKVPFTVIKALNLNADPRLKDPQVVEKTRKFHPCYALCCVSDAIFLKIVARANIGGYTPGQVINVEININNQSDLSILQLTVELIKQITYFKRANDEHQKWESKLIAKKSAGGCSERQEKTIVVNVDVPPTQPTDISSNLVHVEYLIRVIASTPMFCSKFKLIMPVMIGTYPIQGGGIVTQNVYSRASSAISSDNVILQQPSVVRLPDEDTGPKLTEWNNPPTYADVLRANGKHPDTEYPSIKIAIPHPGEN